jgi:hypothetical protein
LQTIFEKLEAVINIPDNMSEDNSYATENSISSVLKLIYHQKDGTLITDETVKKYLDMLPLKEDLEEAQALNKKLITKVNENNSNLFGDNNCNLERLKQALNRIAAFHIENLDQESLDADSFAQLNNILSSA